MSLTLARRALALSLAAVATATLVACGGSTAEKAPAGGAPAGGTATTVKATLTEFSIALAPATVKAGQVKFDATNGGALAHELIAVKSDLASDKLPVKDGVVEMSGLKSSGTIAQFDAGKSASGTFNLEAGKYIVFCNIAGHYQGGMHTTLTVN